MSIDIQKLSNQIANLLDLHENYSDEKIDVLKKILFSKLYSSIKRIGDLPEKEKKAFISRLEDLKTFRLTIKSSSEKIDDKKIQNIKNKLEKKVKKPVIVDFVHDPKIIGTIMKTNQNHKINNSLE